MKQISFFSSSGADINIAFCKPSPPSDKGNDLTKLLCGPEGLRGAVSEMYIVGMGDPLQELRREYHCAAYNALAALILCTQNQEKFFSAFLFKENPAKRERLFDNLIDTSRCVL